MNSAAEHLQVDVPDQLATDEFARTAGLTPDQVRELIDYGLLRPDQLDLRGALSLREARRQAKDFDFDLFTTGFLAGYLRRIDELQEQMQRLQAERPARTVYSEVSFTAITVK